MLALELVGMFAGKGGRPLSVSAALSAIFLPSSLLVYLTRPDLYERYGIGGGILFGAAVGLPMVFACCWPWQAILMTAVKQEEIQRRIPEALGTVQALPQRSVLEKVTAEDPLEWPVLATGGWTANLVLYSLVVLAYYRPLLLGATLLLTVGVILAVGLIVAVALNLGLQRLERHTDRTVAKVAGNAPKSGYSAPDFPGQAFGLFLGGPASEGR